MTDAATDRDRTSAEPPEGPGRDDAAASRDRWMTVDDVRDVYDEQADRMERFAWCNRRVTGKYRRDLFGRAGGRVLDVACGMGMNRDYVPADAEYVGVDLSPEMLAKAEARDERLVRGETLFEMDAQDLEFEDDSFDAVISSLSTCTFPDPIAALREMARVCEPDGAILLVEHGLSDVGVVARVQEWRAEAHYEAEGCRWTQEPLKNVTEAGLVVRDVRTGFLGMITAIEAEPLDGDAA